MSTPVTPSGKARTEAGRALLRSDFDTTGWSPRVVREFVTMAVLAIEAEATALAWDSPEAVELLAAALHAGSHHSRGGADADLARYACTQFGWEQSRCLAKAKAVLASMRRQSGENGE